MCFPGFVTTVVDNNALVIAEDMVDSDRLRGSVMAVVAAMAPLAQIIVAAVSGPTFATHTHTYSHLKVAAREEGVKVPERTPANSSPWERSVCVCVCVCVCIFSRSSHCVEWRARHRVLCVHRTGAFRGAVRHRGAAGGG